MYRKPAPHGADEIVLPRVRVRSETFWAVAPKLLAACCVLVVGVVCVHVGATAENWPELAKRALLVGAGSLATLGALLVAWLNAAKLVRDDAALWLHRKEFELGDAVEGVLVGRRAFGHGDAVRVRLGCWREQQVEVRYPAPSKDRGKIRLEWICDWKSERELPAEERDRLARRSVIPFSLVIAPDQPPSHHETAGLDGLRAWRHWFVDVLAEGGFMVRFPITVRRRTSPLLSGGERESLDVMQQPQRLPARKRRGRKRGK